MAKRATATVPATAQAVIASLERYELVEVPRADLRNAPYNPRTISEAGKKKLKKIIESHGLVAPPTWNARTGNIVGGHQRISILDILAGSEAYTLKVAKIDVDETREKELNVALNNPEAQGDWDLEKLEKVVSTEGIDLAATGFDVADVYQMFGTAPMQANQIDELADRLQKTQGFYDDPKRQQVEHGPTEFYLVVVFKSPGERVAFTEALKLPDNRFQDGRMLQQLLDGTGITPEQLPDAKILTAEDQLRMRTAIRAELGKLRELARHLLPNRKCFFCKEPLLSPSLLANDRAGDTRGAPLPQVSEITEHHVDGNHDNNDPENRVLCHDSCHRGYHNAARVQKK